MTQPPKSLHKQNLNRSLFALILMTLISWAAWTLVIIKLDPYSSTSLALSFFYITSFLASTGTFTLILFLLKKIRSQEEIYLKHMNISLRQGLLVSIATCLCLALLMLGLLRIWNGLLIVLAITLLEFYFSGLDELR